MHFRIIDSSGAHSDDDIMLMVEEGGTLFAGDLFFSGRIPFIENANSTAWLAALDRMLEVEPKIVVPGYGIASDKPLQKMQLTRDYMMSLRRKMGEAVTDMIPFEEAYDSIEWTFFKKFPAFL
ncbi:MAG TPA: MBL fold metallo-hydrolase [Burkholderiaceae bacterium]|nr:MBL fold metallo-hydrolase [Burkholderiaceae bacterium]